MPCNDAFSEKAQTVQNLSRRCSETFFFKSPLSREMRHLDEDSVRAVQIRFAAAIGQLAWEELGYPPLPGAPYAPHLLENPTLKRALSGDPEGIDPWLVDRWKQPTDKRYLFAGDCILDQVPLNCEHYAERINFLRYIYSSLEQSVSLVSTSLTEPVPEPEKVDWAKRDDERIRELQARRLGDAELRITSDLNAVWRTERTSQLCQAIVLGTYHSEELTFEAAWVPRDHQQGIVRWSSPLPPLPARGEGLTKEEARQLAETIAEQLGGVRYIVEITNGFELDFVGLGPFPTPC